MGNIVIREAGLSDARAVARLVIQLSYPTTTTEMEDRLRAKLARPDYVILVAESSEMVVGLVGAFLSLGMELSGRYGRLTGLVVEEGWRGRGLCRMLMQAVEDWLKGQGASLALITSGKHRLEAHGFYRHLGYEETGLRFAKKLT